MQSLGVIANVVKQSGLSVILSNAKNLINYALIMGLIYLKRNKDKEI